MAPPTADSRGRRRWAFDLSSDSRVATLKAGTANVLALSESSKSALAEPLGFSSRAVVQDEEVRAPARQQADFNLLKQKKAWELATSPGKNLLMTGFMLWMSGSGIHIFSIIVIFMAMQGPVQALMNMNQTFAPFSDLKDLTQPKLVYVLLNFVALGFVCCQ
eukprot:tig00000863_g4968.t1